MKFRFAMLTATLLAVPMAVAFAQSNPAGNLGSNQSITASPGTADKKASSGMSTADANATSAVPSAAARDRKMPGATGSTVVPGSGSTISGDRSGTVDTKTGVTGHGG